MPKTIRRVDKTHIDAGLTTNPEPTRFAPFLELYSEPDQSITKARCKVDVLLDGLEIDKKPPVIPSFKEILKGVR